MNEDFNEKEELQDEYFEHFNIVADEGQEPLRIDKFLMNRMRNVSRNRIQNAAKANCILVNTIPVKSNYKVKPRDQISFVLPHPPRDKEIKPENIPLDIIYEDPYLLILNKPAGMVVHPGYSHFTGTLVNALVYHFDQLPTSKNGKTRPGLVHRLDKNTSGLMVIAKEEYAMTHLANQFFHHSINRHYQALTWGEFQENEGTVEGNLARSKQDRRVMQVYKQDIGKHAVTHFKVVERFHYTTLLDCWLETGRTHQIRAHMKHIGHPLFADDWYGGMEIKAGPPFSKYKQFIDNCFKLCPRQALHAYSLGFIHPETNKKMYFEQPLPGDMEQLILKWRKFSTETPKN